MSQTSFNTRISQVRMLAQRVPGVGWTVCCPALPGCVSQGDTLDEAIRNGEEALAGVMDSYEDDGGGIPWELNNEVASLAEGYWWTVHFGGTR